MDKIYISELQGRTFECRPGTDVVVFSHSFLRQRDNAGMFRDIIGRLPSDCGYVLFDYDSRLGPGVVELATVAEREQHLSRAIDMARTILEPQRLHVVAHSLGCQAVTGAQPTGVESVTLIAPAVEKIGKRVEQNFWERHPTRNKELHVWEVPHTYESSGEDVRLLVRETLFSEFQTGEPGQAALAYADFQRLTIFGANQDTMLGDVRYVQLANHPNARVRMLDGDHDFTGAARPGLVNEVVASLPLAA